ncbi:MAG: hypothetical protein ABI999_05510 [Acidobacteriota bacterium]
MYFSIAESKTGVPLDEIAFIQDDRQNPEDLMLLAKMLGEGVQETREALKEYNASGLFAFGPAQMVRDDKEDDDSSIIQASDGLPF